MDQESSPANRRIWYSRGYLPHYDDFNLIQMITFRLVDSLPKSKLLELEELRRRKVKHNFDRWLDAGYGSCWLADPWIAELMQDMLIHFDAQRYSLIAWVVMPNHVHAIVKIFPEFTLAKVVLSWKSYTARKANEHFNRSGAFWMREYHDRFMRGEDHCRAAIEYIEYNPVKAGLVASPQDWKYSSASRTKDMPR